MKIANRKNEDSRCRQSDYGPLMPFIGNSPMFSQLSALRPGKGSHHV
jgi:hypothetical protein